MSVIDGICVGRGGKVLSSSNSATRHAALNGGALATVALGSGIQVALYLRDFGATHRTDGVIAAIAVYSLVVVLGQLLRTTAVPLLSGERPVLSNVEFGWGVGVIALLVAVLCAALASLIAHFIAGASGSTGRHVAAQALVIMAPAIGLQVAGSGVAVAGAVRGRLGAVSLAFIGSSVAGLLGFFLLRASAELVLAWANLIGSVGLIVGLLVGVRVTLHPPPGARRLIAATLALVRSIPLPASFVFMYPLTLALAPHDRPGQITLFGLAFTACSYLAGFTGQALSMVDAVALSRLDGAAIAERRAVVIRSFRSSLLLAAPGIGIAAVAGGPIVHALVPARAHGSSLGFGVDIVLLIPWLVATLGVWATLPALISGHYGLDGRRLDAAFAGLVVLHVVASLVGRAVWGFDGVVIAMAIAPAAFTAAGLRMAVPSAASRLLQQLGVVGAAAAVSFGVLELASRAVADGSVVSAVVASVIGAAVYSGLAALAFPDAVRTFARLVTGR